MRPKHLIALLLVSLLIFTVAKSENLSKDSPRDFISLSTVDSVPSPAPLISDSVKIISIRDIDLFYTFLQENVSKANYDKLTPDKVLTVLYQWAIEKNKPPVAQKPMNKK